MKLNIAPTFVQRNRVHSTSLRRKRVSDTIEAYCYGLTMAALLLGALLGAGLFAAVRR